MFCFWRANRASTNLKTFLSWKLDKFTLFAPSLVGWNLENLRKHAVSISFCLSWHFKREKPVFLESIFISNQELITYTSFVNKTLQLVRISLLVTALNKEFTFFPGKLFYESSRKLSCICIAWNKHARGWEDSQQLCKPSTLSRVFITVSISLNTSRVYIRLCKHGKRFLLLKSCIPLK